MGTSKYPPTQEDVLETFLAWLNKQRTCEYQITNRPDKDERTRKAIDYLLSANGQKSIGVEVSSVWRSSDAGQEDAFFLRWSEDVSAAAQGKLSGRFSAGVPIKIQKGVTAQKFADELIAFCISRLDELKTLHKRARGITTNLCGIKAFIAIRDEKGSNVSFGRFEPTNNFEQQVGKLIQERGPKLQQPKNDGYETWLVVYNTFWVAMSDYEVRESFLKALQSGYEYIDHVAVVEGNPPNDAWTEQIR